MLRTFRTAPRFAVAIILTIAIGIGPTTAILMSFAWAPAAAKASPAAMTRDRNNLDTENLPNWPGHGAGLPAGKL